MPSATPILMENLPLSCLSFLEKRELDEMFDKLDADSPQLPTAETSACVTALLDLPLMPHQTEGFAWMVQREEAPDASGEEKKKKRSTFQTL